MEKSDDFSKLIKEGIDGELVIIGYPYDIGGKREQRLPLGQDHGPDCLRRFFNKSGSIKNAEYNIDMNNLEIRDYGNIQLDNDKNNINIEKCLEKLYSKFEIINKREGIPLIIGGTKDVSYGGLKYLLSKEKNRVGYLNISSFLDIKPIYDGNKISSICTQSKIIEEFSTKINNGQFRVLNFGIQDHNISYLDKKYLEPLMQSVQITKLSEIRNLDLNIFSEEIKKITTPITQAAITLNNKLDYLNEMNEIYVSISIESINSCFAPGTSNPSVIGGLTCEEIIEIMFILGNNKKVVGIDIVDYNPTIEDFRTGHLIVKMLYYFIMGYTIRK